MNERKSLFLASFEQSRLFDKAILTLAAGAFGLSLTFIRQFVPEGQAAKSVCLLILSWIFLSTSILSTLFSFITSQYACERQIKVIEEEHSGKSNSNNNWRILTIILNIISIIFFLIGIIFLAGFGIVNL